MGISIRLSVVSAVRNLLGVPVTDTKGSTSTFAVIPVTGKPEGTMENTIMLEDTEKTVYCRRCGRKLKNPIYQELGYGKICYSKVNLYPGVKPLFVVKKGKNEESKI